MFTATIAHARAPGDHIGGGPGGRGGCDIGGGIPGLIGGGIPGPPVPAYGIAGAPNCGRSAAGAGPPTPRAGPLRPGAAPIMGGASPRPAETPIPGPCNDGGTAIPVAVTPFRGRSSCCGGPSIVIETTCVRVCAASFHPCGCV